MHTHTIQTPKCVESQDSIHAWLSQKTNYAIARFNTWSKARKQHRLNREALQHLTKLDNRILNDIGLTRADVIWASDLPLSQNAAQELENISKMNRRSR